MRLRRILSLSLPTVALVGWWIATDGFEWVSPLVLPSPITVFRALWQAILEGYREHSLAFHLWSSLRRLVLGFGIALAVGAPLGMWLGRHPTAKAVAYPAIELIRPLPPLGYYAVLVLWLGIYEASKIALLGLAAFAPIVLATLDAVERTPAVWIRAGQLMGMSNRQLYYHVYIPAALPGILTGMRVGLGFAFTTLVAAEMVAASAGIGWVILDASRYLRNEVIFMGNFLLGLTALCLDRAMLVLRRHLIPWSFQDPAL